MLEQYLQRISYVLRFLCFQSFLGGLFGPVCEIDVVLNDAENRKTAELKTEDGKVEKHYLFYDGESVSGKVIMVLVSKIHPHFVFMYYHFILVKNNIAIFCKKQKKNLLLRLELCFFRN